MPTVAKVKIFLTYLTPSEMRGFFTPPETRVKVQSVAVNLVWESGGESNILGVDLGTVLTYNLVAPSVSIGI